MVRYLIASALVVLAAWFLTTAAKLLIAASRVAKPREVASVDAGVDDAAIIDAPVHHPATMSISEIMERTLH